jgi:hypothetical protein
MLIATKLSSLFSRLTRARPASAKPSWGRQSHIDILADNLPRDREGWVVEHNSIRRNGVIIAWSGPLSAGGTSVTVKMDGQRYPVTANEARKLKERLTELLAASPRGAPHSRLTTPDI